jgi:hypothetical protein
MMAKDPAGRYADAGAVAEALAPFTPASIAPPPEQEMPRLCRAARYDNFPEPQAVPTPAAAPDRPDGPGVPGPELVAAAPPAPDLPVAPDVAEPKKGVDTIIVEKADLLSTLDLPEPTAIDPAREPLAAPRENGQVADSGEARDEDSSVDLPPVPSPPTTAAAATVAEGGWPALSPPEAETAGPDSAPERDSAPASPAPEREDRQDPSRPTHEPFAEEPPVPPALLPVPASPAGEKAEDVGPVAPESAPRAGKQVRAAARRRKARSKRSPSAPEPAPEEAPPAKKRPSVPEKRPTKAPVARAGPSRARPFPQPRAPEPKSEGPAPAAEESPYDKPAAPAPRPTPPRRDKDRHGALPLLIVGVVVACGVALGVVALFNRGGKEPETPIEISGEQLLREFRENEVIANQKYFGKLVEIRGEVYSRADEKLGLYVSRGERGMIYCRLSDKDQDTVSSFKKGEKLIVKGICDGVTTFVSGVALRDCEFRK